MTTWRVLLVSLAGLRSQRLPRALNWLGVVTGLAGLVSNIPPLRESAVIFGLLQILWFAWLGIVLLRTKQQPEPAPGDEAIAPVHLAGAGR
jgi:hypothetical protein